MTHKQLLKFCFDLREEGKFRSASPGLIRSGISGTLLVVMLIIISLLPFKLSAEQELIRELCALGTLECSKLSIEECKVMATSSLKQCSSQDEISECAYNKFGEDMENRKRGYTDCKLEFLLQLKKQVD